MRLNIKSILTKATAWIKANKLLVLLFVVFVILRFYNLSEHVTFLGDQGRDAIIIKRILTLEHLPAIGAPTSIGMVYLGPFYYYFMAPWLALFALDPIGLAIGVAVISIMAAFITFFLLRKNFSFLTAVFWLLLVTFSAVNIKLSRFSWNPNLLPIFTFSTLYFFYQLFQHPKLKYSLGFGFFFACAFQLHYLSLALLPTFAIFSVYKLIKQPKQKLKYLQQIIYSILVFFFFSSPLLIFDLRHNFLNTHNLIDMLTKGGATSSQPYFPRLISSTGHFLQFVFQIPFPNWLTFFVIAGIIIMGVNTQLKKADAFFWINLLSIASFLVLFSLMNSGYYEHYYVVIYYSFFFILASIFAKRFEVCKICRLVLVPLFCLYLILNLYQLHYLLGPGSHQIQTAKVVSRSIYPQITKIPYQIAPLPYTETEGQYRYFLEIWGKTPLPENTLEVPSELFVICHLKECNVLNDPQWQIAAFQNKKIAKIWNIENLKIYKIIHGNK